MSIKPPDYETRRERDLREELLNRARSWLSGWEPGEEGGEFGKAMFSIAARLSAEATQRLNRVGEKNFRGLLHWLGVQGKSAHAARMPVVFSMTPRSPPELARRPIRLQAKAVDPPVVFETQQDVQVVAATPVALVGTYGDQFFTAPAAVYQPQPPQPLPSRWRTKSAAPKDARQLQLNPAEGLSTGDVLRIDHADGSTRPIKEYRVTESRAGIVSIAPALHADVGADIAVTRAPAFDPFQVANDEQKHELYIGDGDALNIKGSATFQITNLGPQFLDLTWQYSAKTNGIDDWLPLEASFVGGELVLKKTAGTIEKVKVGGVESRWLRAVASDPFDGLFVERLQLKINCLAEKPAAESPSDGLGEIIQGAAPTPPANGAGAAPTLELAAFANTAPLVLDQNFYPLGIEPRVFDAFYLSCPEAFSKQHAKIAIELRFADPTAKALAAVKMPGSNNSLIFGVGADGQLHRLQHDVRLNRVSFMAPARASVSSVRGVSASRPKITAPLQRGSVAAVGSDAAVAVVAEDGVWLWIESMQSGQSTWRSLGKPADKPVSQALVVADGNKPLVYALSNGKLYCHDESDGKSRPEWQPIDSATIALLAPILSADAPLAGGNVTNGLALVDEKGALHRYVRDHWDPILEGTAIDKDVAPLMLVTAQGIAVVAKMDREDTLVAKRGDDSELVTVEVIGLARTLATPALFDFILSTAGELTVFFISENGANPAGTRRASWWSPFEPGKSAIVFSGPDTAGFATINGTPVVLQAESGAIRVLVPGMTADVLLMPFDPRQTVTLTASLQDVLAVSLASPVADDLVALRAGGERLERIVQVIRLAGAQRLLRLEKSLLRELDVAEVRLFHPVASHTVQRESDKKIRFANVGDVPPVETAIAVETPDGKRLFKVKHRKDEVATLDRTLPSSTEINIQVLAEPETTTAELRPAVDTSSLSDATVELLRAGALYFSGALPQPQHIETSVPLPADANVLLLESAWSTFPATASVSTVVAAPQAGWSIYRPRVQANPKLSYEYWDGKGWWKIDGLVDETQDFLHNGLITFCLPGNLEETEVAGRRAHWIRARLVGGDYGQPEVTVTMIEGKDAANNKQITQIIDRNMDAVRAPLAVWIDVRYTVCCPVTPADVLTHDNGAFVNQSEANRTRVASIEVFPPLSRVTGETDRALYLGFDAPVSGAPINLLFLVQQGNHEDAFPLDIEALRVGGFERVLSDDGTRGLSETGIVSLMLSEPPVKAGLFGKEGHWLRIKPNPRMTRPWNPAITSVFLNAAMAYAAETQELELLGSSDGSPRLKATLARAPVVEGSLELRVREPLTDEQIDALTAEDADAVKENLRNLGGQWVLWKEVADPLDHGPEARVYSLDADTGVVQFGDGRHGAVPPIGRDAIMAVRYQRSGDARANEIEAWSPVNLVTPVSGVQAVIVPEPAAGGTNSEPQDAVLRTAPGRIQHRDRALTLRDIEQLALASSSDVVQAVARRGASGTIRVIVVGRPPDEVPVPATLRQVRASLLASSTPDLGCPGRLAVLAPKPLSIRVELGLLVADIEDTGRVAREATDRIARLFDTLAGGLDGAGWPVGARPEDADFAAALTDLAGLEGITRSECLLLREDENVIPLPAKLRDDELIKVDEGDIKVTFELSASEVPT